MPGFAQTLADENAYVESERFAGTCYRAANWIHVGSTTGRGKLDRTHQGGLAVKDVYCYPLKANATATLTAPLA